MTNLSKAAANKIINACYDAIPYIGTSFSDVKSKMYNMEYKAEKEHRASRPAVAGFGVMQAAKYFTVQHLFEAMKAITLGKQLYTVKDILHIRNECLYAQAYAEENGDKLLEWMHIVEASDFDKVDYAEMMK